MSEQVAFELVSPEKLLLSEAVDMVLIPGAEGDMGVLPGHAPVISTIRPGTICVFENSVITKRIFVAGGFAEIADGRCTVLAEDAVVLDDLKAGDVETQIGHLKDDISIARDNAEKAVAEAALLVAEAKLDALNKPAYA